MAIDGVVDQHHDLDSRTQIHHLVVGFYRDVALDDLLGPVFGEVAEVDWSAHIPRLIDYWCRVLLGHPGYDGYSIAPHHRVHDLEAFRPELFDRWYRLFVDTLDDGWQGPIAENAKAHAERIAGSLARRLLGVPGRPRTVAASDLRPVRSWPGKPPARPTFSNGSGSRVASCPGSGTS
jgi:hemoglobin